MRGLQTSFVYLKKDNFDDVKAFSNLLRKG